MFRKKKTIKDSLIEIGVDVSKPIGAYILEELTSLGFLEYVKLIIHHFNDGLDIWIYLGDKNPLGRAIATIYATGIQHEDNVWASDEPGTGQFNGIQSTYDIYGNLV